MQDIAVPTGKAGSPSPNAVSTQGVAGGTPVQTRITAAGAFTTGQVPFTASAVRVVAARAGRRAVMISSRTAVDLFFGPDSSVSATTGYYAPAAAGISVVVESEGEIWVFASAAVTLTFMDLF